MVSTRRRFEVLKRDGFRCHYCGATPLGGCVLEVEWLIAAIDAVGARWGETIYHRTDATKYFYGCLRNMAKEHAL